MTAGWIVTDPDVLGGKPCVRGTRLSVEFMLELAAGGASQAEILASYPQLNAEALAAAFSYAACVLNHDRPIDLPRMPLESLEQLSPQENARIWAEEAQCRLSALDRGELSSQPADDVFREARTRTKP